jgi:hypothetical protein
MAEELPAILGGLRPFSAACRERGWIGGRLSAFISSYFDENCHPFLFLTDYLIRSPNYLDARQYDPNIAGWPKRRLQRQE